MSSPVQRLRALADRPADRFSLDVDFPRGTAAVLGLVVEAESRDPKLVLTRRASHLSADGGLMSFPGGRSEPGESAIETAGRETTEEVGVAASEFEIVGRLDDIWSGNGMHVTPIVALSLGPLRYSPNEAEVAAVHEVALDVLADPARHSQRITNLEGHDFVDAVIDLDDIEPGLEVFGLTADLVLDITTWVSGGDRRRRDQRQADLRHYTKIRWA